MRGDRLRIAAVGITPPVFKASGGIAAAIHLTEKVAALRETRMFLMAPDDSDAVERGLHIDRRRCTNPYARLERVLPRQIVTMGWRPQLRRWLQAWRPDVVHLHNPHPPGALTSAARTCADLRLPYVISTHGFVECDEFARGMNMARWKVPLFRYLIRRPVAAVARHAARVLMLSPEEEPILLGMGARPDRLRVVTNGVDPYFRETLSTEARLQLVRRFGLPMKGPPRMLFVGNHTRNKGLDVLLRAVKRMECPGVALVAGAIRSRQEHRALLDECEVSADDPRIIFTDFVTKEELRALYQSVDVFVFPSRADTLPLVILEAMASGLPVVSTRVGGIPYEVTPETGVLVEAGDPEALAAALTTLCADRALRVKMGDAGRERAISLFDWEASARRAVEIYETI